MSGESQAGWASVVMLLHGLLWWGGALGCAALVLTSADSVRHRRAGVRSAPAVLSRHDHRVLELRRQLARLADGAGTLVDPDPDPDPDRVTVPAPAARSTSSSDLLVLAAGCSAAAAGVHLAMAPLHGAAGALHVGFFVVVGALQAAQAGRLLLRPERSVLQGVLLLDLTVVLVWLASRTVGVLGPTEPVGSWDLVASAWELTCVVLALRLLRTAQPLRRPVPDPATWSPLVLGALGLTALTLVLLPLGGH